MTQFYVVSGQKQALMGCATALMLGVVTFTRRVKRGDAETTTERGAGREPRRKRHEDVAATALNDRAIKTVARQHEDGPHHRQPGRGEKHQRREGGERITKAAVAKKGTTAQESTPRPASELSARTAGCCSVSQKAERAPNVDRSGAKKGLNPRKSVGEAQTAMWNRRVVPMVDERHIETERRASVWTSEQRLYKAQSAGHHATVVAQTRRQMVLYVERATRGGAGVGDSPQETGHPGWSREYGEGTWSPESALKRGEAVAVSFQACLVGPSKRLGRASPGLTQHTKSPQVALRTPEARMERPMRQGSQVLQVQVETEQDNPRGSGEGHEGAGRDSKKVVHRNKCITVCQHTEPTTGGPEGGQPKEAGAKQGCRQPSPRGLPRNVRKGEEVGEVCPLHPQTGGSSLEPQVAADPPTAGPEYCASGRIGRSPGRCPEEAGMNGQCGRATVEEPEASTTLEPARRVRQQLELAPAKKRKAMTTGAPPREAKDTRARPRSPEVGKSRR